MKSEEAGEVVRTADRAVAGEPLDSETVRIFDQAYKDFLANKTSRQEIEEQIEEMANLLTISQRNLEQVQQQGWFKRSWKSITGHNRKLERVNQANLLRVQKGALIFLQRAAESDRQMMHTVAFALKRLEDIQIESIKLKGYLAQAVRKYNKRLRAIEENLDDHEGKIRRLRYQGKYALIAVLLICASILCLILASRELRWWLFGAGLFSAGIFGWLTFRLDTAEVQGDGIPGEAKGKHIPSIAELNRPLRTEIENTLRLQVRRNLDGFIYPPFEEFAESTATLDKIYARFKEAPPSRESFISDVKELAKVTPPSLERIEEGLRGSSERFVSGWNDVIKGMAADGLPEVTGLDAIVSVDVAFQSQLGDDLCASLQPYSGEFRELQAIHRRLATGEPKFSRIASESFATSLGKAFLEVLTCTLYSGSSKDDEFMQAYSEDLCRFGEKWDNLLRILANSIFALHQATYERATETLLKGLSPLWDEFDEQQVSLQAIADGIRKGLEDPNSAMGAQRGWPEGVRRVNQGWLGGVGLG